MKIHKEGYRIILAAAIILIVIDIALYFITAAPLKHYLWGFSFVFFLFVVQFFRHPKRQLPDDENAIFSPADGQIAHIETCIEKEYFKAEMQKISIFMSIINVHLNRVPVNGKVVYHQYHKGKYLLAFYAKSSDLNENNAFAFIDQNKNPVFVRQIAGFLARRIRWYIKEGQEVKKGQELGFIRFGSRVDIYLPLHAKINIKQNQQVYGNKTIIAYL